MIPVIDGHNDLAWARRKRHDLSTRPLDAVVAESHTDIPGFTQAASAASSGRCGLTPRSRVPHR